MIYESDELRFGLEMLLFKGDFKREWKNFVLLEKLLLALNNSSCYNTEAFDNIDANELIVIYSTIDSNFTDTLYSIYAKYCQQSNDLLYKENFNKMTRLNEKSARKPNIHLLNAFADILIKGYLGFKDGKYYSVEPLVDFSDYNCSSLPHHYIMFCKAVSIIKNEPFKAQDIESGNNCILQLTSNDLPLITNILNQKIYISEYNPLWFSITDDYEYEDSYKQILKEELYAPLPWELPRHTMSHYESFSTNRSDSTYLTDALSNIPDGLLLWLHAYCTNAFLTQDPFFHQILFLLAFVSDTTLDEYIHFIPSYSLTVPNTRIRGYYEDIQRINCLPSIDCFFKFETDINNFVFNNLIRIFSSETIPNWLLFTMYYLTDKQLQAAKNLYITLVLRKRYHKQKDNDSFPAEIIDLLRKTLPNIDSIYELCN